MPLRSDNLVIRAEVRHLHYKKEENQLQSFHYRKAMEGAQLGGGGTPGGGSTIGRHNKGLILDSVLAVSIRCSGQSVE